MEEYRPNNIKVYQKDEANKKIYFDKINELCLRKVDIFSAEDHEIGIKRFHYLNCINKFGSTIGVSFIAPQTF